jgi:hypothetical protein
MANKETIDIISEMRKVAQRLSAAEEYGLVTEVIVFALDAMKGTPSLTISQAFEIGCREWDV